MFSKTQIQQIIAKLLRSGNKQKLTRIIERMHIADIVDTMLNLMPAEQKELLESLLDIKKAGPTLLKLPKGVARDLMSNFSDAQLTIILKRLKPRESKSLLRTLPEERSQLLLTLLERETSSHLTELLLHPENSVGDLMSPTYFSLAADTLVREALEYPRHMKGEVNAFYLYVVDEQNRLLGVIPIHDLLMVEPSLKLREIMDRDVIRVPLEASKEEVAELFRRYNLLSIPVVDDMEVLQGVVSIDNIMEVLQEEATEEMYKIAGLDKEDRVFVKPIKSVRKRLPWLSINILTALVGALVMNSFLDTINQMVSLVIFMPVIAGLGGNTGAQTLTVIVRGLALGEVQLSSAKRVIMKEVVVGLINGLVIGTIVAIVATVWKGPVFLGLIVALAMLLNLVVASLIGTIVPLTLKYLGFDPAIASNIFVTATTDIFGFFVYLGLATFFMPLLI